MKRVVVTGYGTVNPLGHNVNDTWNNIKEGRSGIGLMTKVDTTELPVKVAAEIKDFTIDGLYKFPKKAKKMDNFVHYAAHAMKEAVEMADINFEADSYRVGINISSSIGGVDSQQKNIGAYAKRGIRGIGPYYIPQTIANIASGFLSAEYGIKGPSFNIQSACATGNHSLASGLMAIQCGQADVMITGGTDSGINDVTVGGFIKLNALSTEYSENPEKSSRPFDKDRDGFVMGEGSAVIILEEYEHAKKRGANILCELVTVSMTSDAYELVQPDPEGNGVYNAMRIAAENANIRPEDVDYINAHATSTPVGDIAESKAISRFLDGKTDDVLVGSTKSMHGHLLGATAAMEAILCIKAIEEGVVPGTINLENIDEKINLDCINRETVKKDVNYVMSNSFGFGGHNTCAVFAKIK